MRTGDPLIAAGVSLVTALILTLVTGYWLMLAWVLLSAGKDC